MTQESLQLKDKSLLISGADSGIGKAAALLFAKHGANIAIIYYSDQKDAEDTQQEIRDLGARCIILQGDVNDSEFCQKAVKETVSEFGKLDIFINNAGTQFPSDI